MSDRERALSVLRALPEGAEAIERIEHLERSWGAAVGKRSPLPSAGPAPERGERLDADVIIAGGGLWMILAPYLARRGLSVVVLDRGVIGRGHREWNISGPELDALSQSGLFDDAEVRALVVARYLRGVCRWHQGGTYPVTGVLDHAVDGEAFLGAVRAKAEAAGVRLLDGHPLSGISTGPHGVRVRAGSVTLAGRVLIDALGSSSPHARVDLGCPTVGGVLRGLPRGQAPDEVDATVGDVLVTVDHRDDGRQHVWEGFPGRDGDFTTYLFHYARADRLPPSPLLSLYGRLFRTRERYKRGEAEVARLTYGIIPGWTRLTAPPVTPPRVLLVGDAAARHSPLTFCGFGSMVRSFAAVGDGLVRALGDDDVSTSRLASLAPEPALLRGVGALALLLAEPRASSSREAPDATNRLLDAAFRSLFEAGDVAYGSFLRDEASLRDLVGFLWTTSLRRPAVYRDVMAHLSLGELVAWGKQLGDWRALVPH